MSAKRHLHLLLVASLIVFLFALVPASAEETNLNIVKINHYNSKNVNYINVEINNSEDDDVNCNLVFAIYSKDLRENIPLDNSITFFDIDNGQNYNHTFYFDIPRSGDYNFNFTLLVENNEIVKEYYLNEEYTFYDYQDYQIDEIITDYYYDPSDNANWLYDAESKHLELNNIQEQYDTGIVLGPFETVGLTKALLNLEYLNEKSDTANYTISATTEFNSSEIYGTEWLLLHSVNDETAINLEMPRGNEVFILLRAQDAVADTGNYWKISEIYLEKLTVKHSLSIYSQPHYFFDINDKTEIILQTENNGRFNQQLGNISIIAELFSENEMIKSYAELPSIGSGENQNIKINIDENLAPGHYFIDLETTIIDKHLFFDETLILISISNHNYGQIDLNLSKDENPFNINTQNEKLEMLINTEQINQLNISSDFTISELISNYYIVEINNAPDKIELSTMNYFTGNIISMINMDEVKYSVIDEETPIYTIEGITAPSIIFDDGNEKIITIKISNEGFYTETYQLNYIYSSTFIEEIEGIETIQVQPNKVESIDIKIKPSQTVPREGGSQFNIEVSNNNENKIFTYLFSYLKPTIVISEIGCDRYALLDGQSLKCTTVLTNEGYSVDNLKFVIYSEENIIEEVNIDSLDYLETWTLTTTYEPKIVGEVTITATIITSNGEVFEKEIDSKIKIIATESSARENSNQIYLPEINAGKSLILLSLAGILYQIKRSENLKYLGLKFFFIPMYSRLQKDTLADEPTRQKLLKYIYAEPGANFKQLKDKFSLHNGTLAHHINILENHDIITSHRSGRQRLFFPMGVNQEISRISLVTNETQRNIMDIVKETPGITQSMISKQMNMSRQKINYHVNSLVDKAFLKIEKHGRITRLYPLYYT